MSRYVSAAQAAEMLGLTVDYFRRKVAKQVTRYRIGRRLLFAEEDIDNYIKSRVVHKWDSLR